MATSLTYTQGLFPMDYGPFFNGPWTQPYLMPSNMTGPGTQPYLMPSNIPGPGTWLQPQPYTMTSNMPGPGTWLQPQPYTMTSNMSGLLPMNNGQGPLFNAEYVKYFHHTNGESAQKILKSFQIRQSEGNDSDAIMGNGTYLTTYGPSTPRSVVAKNNYDTTEQYWKDKIQDGRTEYIFEMLIRKDQVRDCSKKCCRDIHLYPGNINLLEVQCLKVHRKIDDTTYNTTVPEILWPAKFRQKNIH